MKKKDFGIILIVLMVAGVMWLISSVIYSESGEKLRIMVDNQEFGVYDLQEDCVIEIGDTNECQIKGGKVTMLYGDCPDQVCVHSAAISKNGQAIICMPNKVVLEIIDGKEDDQIDIMVK